MNHAGLRRQMIEVVHAARDTLRDESNAARLWGSTNDLCDALERDGQRDDERAMIAAVREDIRTGARSTEELADEIVWFVRAIEHDLFEETREILVDEVVSRDQVDG